jgi:hypothetical protein
MKEMNNNSAIIIALAGLAAKARENESGEGESSSPWFRKKKMAPGRILNSELPCYCRP